MTFWRDRVAVKLTGLSTRRHRFEPCSRNHDFIRKGGNLEAASSTGISAILGSTSTITTLVGSVWTLMTSNPLLTVFLCASLLGVGISVFRKIRKTSK